MKNYRPEEHTPAPFSNDSPEEGSSTLEMNVIPVQLDEEAQRRLDVIQELLKPCNRKTYGQKLREAAEKLGVCVRSVQRLVEAWAKEGLAGITCNGRSDKGQHRISEFWLSFIAKTYNENNKGSKRMSPKQVAKRVQTKAREIGDKKPPSYRTVLRVLVPILERKQKAKSIRSPGWQGSTLVLKTRDGDDILVEYSNHIWQCDHTPVDLLVVDQYGEVLGRPWLTTVLDTYSRCIMGINLGFDAPSSQVVALALRHAILPKQYSAGYKLNCEWGTYGKPTYFFTDGGKDFRSNHVQQIGVQLGFSCHLRNRPSEGGVVERPFRTLNQQLFSTLPGYVGSNVEERPKDAEKDACLTLQTLEQLLVRFIVDQYNQSIDARMRDQTRFQRWEAGLQGMPDFIDERLLDICLMKAMRRSVQRGGYLQFENVMYRGEFLEGYAGESVSLRYNPDDITTVLIYRQENNNEVFLTRAHAQGLETDHVSLTEVRSSSRKLREAGKAISNESILQEIHDRDAVVASQKTRKERQKDEQDLLRSIPAAAAVANGAEPSQELSVEPEGMESTNDDLMEDLFAPIDFDELNDEWG